MQIEISQDRQFKYSIVYVVKDAISYNCFTTIMQHFVVKKCFYFKTPDGAASISSPSYCQLNFQRESVHCKVSMMDFFYLHMEGGRG